MDLQADFRALRLIVVAEVLAQNEAAGRLRRRIIDAFWDWDRRLAQAGGTLSSMGPGGEFGRDTGDRGLAAKAGFGRSH